MPDATPHHGIPPFVLGMTRPEALAAAGSPDSLEQQSGGEVITSETWAYSSMQAEIKFEEKFDWRMSSITIEATSATVKGASLIGCRATELSFLAASAGIPDVRKTDDFAESGKCHASDLFNLQFWEHDGRIVKITLFPHFEESGNVPRWPAA